MTPEIRNALVMSRTADYFGIVRTTLLIFLGVAAIEAFAPGGFSLPLAILTITVTVFGILAGNTCLDDIIALREDMNAEMAATAYGAGVKTRNIPMLKMISMALLALVGLAELVAIIT